jgi:hypothetical protein
MEDHGSLVRIDLTLEKYMVHLNLVIRRILEVTDFQFMRKDTVQ